MDLFVYEKSCDNFDLIVKKEFTASNYCGKCSLIRIIIMKLTFRYIICYPSCGWTHFIVNLRLQYNAIYCQMYEITAMC